MTRYKFFILYARVKSQDKDLSHLSLKVHVYIAYGVIETSLESKFLFRV